MFQTLVAFVLGAVFAEPAAKLLRPVVRETVKGGAKLTHKIGSVTAGARDSVTGVAAAAATGLRESEFGRAVNEGIAEAKGADSKPAASETPRAKPAKKRATKTAPA